MGSMVVRAARVWLMRLLLLRLMMVLLMVVHATTVRMVGIVMMWMMVGRCIEVGADQHRIDHERRWRRRCCARCQIVAMMAVRMVEIGGVGTVHFVHLGAG